MISLYNQVMKKKAMYLDLFSDTKTWAMWREGA
jgi:hypothetical protein